MANPDAQLPFSHPQTPVSSKCNVWGIGFTLWSLLSGKVVDVGYVNAVNTLGYFAQETGLDSGAIAWDQYSETLKGVIVSYFPRPLKKRERLDG